MQAKKRLPDVSVIQGLIDEPERFQFFQTVRTLVRWLRPVGMPYDQALSHVLRFQNSLSLNFAPSQIEALWAEPRACATDIDLQQAMRDHDGATICVTPAFMGLLGGNGAMPIHHTERIDQARRTNKDNGDGARAFIDLFSQRMLSMFFQAWGKYRLEHRLDMGDDDTQLPMLTALAGMPPDPRSDAARDVADETTGFYAALLRTRPVAASSVSRVLTQQFGVPVELEPFVETWDVIPENKRSKLGGKVAKLGFGAALGGRVRRRDLRVRLNIGPLDKVEAERFLPRSAAAVALAKTMAMFDLPNLQVEARVLFKPSCVKRLVLNSTSRTARRLNWDAFLPGKHDNVSKTYAGYLMHPADMDADGNGCFRAIGVEPA